MELFTVRTTGEFTAARRTAARVRASAVGHIPPGTVVRMEKWTRGQMIGDNDVWYGDRSGWVWSGSFEGDVDTSNLRPA